MKGITMEAIAGILVNLAEPLVIILAHILSDREGKQQERRQRKSRNVFPGNTPGKLREE